MGALIALRRLFGRQRRRLAVWWSKPCRRGELASSSQVSRHRAGRLEAELYRLQVNGHAGLGVSVYVADNELLRVDCLGAHGHFHINLHQSCFASAGEVQRISLRATSVRDQFEEALWLIGRDLEGIQRCNWSPKVRAQPISAKDRNALITDLRLAFRRFDGVDLNQPDRSVSTSTEYGA